MQRYLIIDFETNGKTCDKVMPMGAFPTQVSVDAFDPETGEVHHLYDSSTTPRYGRRVRVYAIIGCPALELAHRFMPMPPSSASSQPSGRFISGADLSAALPLQCT